MELVYFLICFVSCLAGAIGGIGGGIIIKPVMDAISPLAPSVIHFLSGCTVLTMTAYSVTSSWIAKNSLIALKSGTAIALGGAVGGLFGKAAFQALLERAKSPGHVTVPLSLLLLFLTIGALLYHVNRRKITPRIITGTAGCVAVGCALGLVSAFLGIGGGPFNLIVLHYFFGMPTKTAAQNSLYIILFSQLTSLLGSFAARTVPQFPPAVFLFMAAGGIAGGIVGRKINRRLSERNAARFYTGLLLLIIIINVYNVIKFSGLIAA